MSKQENQVLQLLSEDPKKMGESLKETSWWFSSEYFNNENHAMFYWTHKWVMYFQSNTEHPNI